MKNRITPENITELKEFEVFVFGSNTKGIHGAGAAKLACIYFGADIGTGYGFSNNLRTFAIPTKGDKIETLPLYVIEAYVKQALNDIKGVSKIYTFLVTEIGCGLARYKPEQIAPFFRKAIEMENIHLPQRFWDVLNKHYDKRRDKDRINN